MDTPIPMDSPVTLSDEVREKIVLALTSTTREQCRGWLAFNGMRCGVGVVLEALGFTLLLEKRKNATIFQYDGWETHEDAFVCNNSMTERACDSKLLPQVVPLKLLQDIMCANDTDKKSFDEIAKIVKDWQPKPELDYSSSPFSITFKPAPVLL